MEAAKEIMKSLNSIRIDIDLIKDAVLDEGELTDWAKRQLAKARATPDSEYVSLDEVEKRILAR